MENKSNVYCIRLLVNNDCSFQDFSDVESDEEVQMAHTRSDMNQRHLTGPALLSGSNNWHEEGRAPVHGCPVADPPDWTVQPCMLSPDNRAFMVAIADYTGRYPGDRVAVSTPTTSVPRTASCAEMGQGRAIVFSQPQQPHRSVSFQHDNFKPPHA